LNPPNTRRSRSPAGSPLKDSSAAWAASAHALDNAMCESLIGTMKIEKLDRQA
jgi:hypothetical protein